MKSAFRLTAAEFNESVLRSASEMLETSIWKHPRWGTVKHRTFQLQHLRIEDTVTELSDPLEITYDGKFASQMAHHCISFDGLVGINYYDHSNTLSPMDPTRYRYSSGPRREYGIVYGKQLRNVHLAIDLDYYGSLLDESEDWTARLKDSLMSRKDFIDFFGKSTPAMIHTASEIFRSDLTGSLQKLYIEAKAQELIALQLAGLQPGERKRQDIRNLDLFTGIREYLDQTFLKEHSMQSLSRHFGINEFKLKQGFKRHFQTTVFDYILARRLEHAKRLLLDTDQNVQQVGLMVGYSHANHFSTAFKKRYGFSPGKLKQ